MIYYFPKVLQVVGCCNHLWFLLFWFWWNLNSANRKHGENSIWICEEMYEGHVTARLLWLDGLEFVRFYSQYSGFLVYREV